MPLASRGSRAQCPRQPLGLGQSSLGRPLWGGGGGAGCGGMPAAGRGGFAYAGDGLRGVVASGGGHRVLPARPSLVRPRPPHASPFCAASVLLSDCPPFPILPFPILRVLFRLPIRLRIEFVIVSAFYSVPDFSLLHPGSAVKRKNCAQFHKY